MSADYFWEATCAGCDWNYKSNSIRNADFRAELHTATTGHTTDLDQNE